ncbi:hypothetical protein [Pseudomonas sp. H1h]|uniref:hypothetical protein n=1 Tax=Pseudomonas sp. H1h TaxID=1397280 RepID=UPI00046A8153|nr:hypothetical protein [Pseudomonas sp. H1h]
MNEQLENPPAAIPAHENESVIEDPSAVVALFSEVAVKKDGSYVVTVAGNRCHVTHDYNAPLFEAVGEYLGNGGDFVDYAEDIVVESDPAVLARLWIDTKLKASENVVSEYRDARDLGQALPITSERFAELLQWRRAVREWPQVDGYPMESTRPDMPVWIGAVLSDE